MTDLGRRTMRRVLHAMGFGVTTMPSDESGMLPTVQLRLDSIRTMDAVPIVQHFGFASCLPVGTQTVRIAPKGDTSGSVIVASLHPSRPTGATPGQVTVYDAVGSKIVLTCDNDIHVYPNGGKLIVHGDARIMGEVQATGEVTAHADAAFTRLSGHKHPSPNASNIITGAPTPNT